MQQIVIYQKPSCTTCRRVYKILVDAGVDFQAVDYYIDPIPRAKLKELLRKMGISALELLRTKEPVYGELRLSGKQLSEDEILDLMVRDPDLIQRPIVEKGAKAILARPADRIREILYERAILQRTNQPINLLTNTHILGTHLLLHDSLPATPR